MIKGTKVKLKEEAKRLPFWKSERLRNALGTVAGLYAGGPRLSVWFEDASGFRKLYYLPADQLEISP